MLVVSKPKRVLRAKECWTRLGVKRDTFYTNFVKTKRLKMFPLGKRAKGALEADLEALIDELAAQR